MAWYYYSGKTPKPVPVKKGASVSLRRGSTVEILMDSPEFEAMVRSGELRKTGAPKGKRKTDEIKVPTQQLKDVMKPVEFANTVVEIGNSGPGYVPVVESTIETKEEVLVNDTVLEVSEPVIDLVANDAKEENDKTVEDGQKEIAQSDVVLEDVKEKIRKRRTPA